jgi:arylsulfatase A-like enzyme
MTAGGSIKTYAAMMKSLDDGVGEVLGALRRARLERDTLVVFTSDNGGERFSFNWPFRGQKFELYEGGLRVPAIVRWPGVVPTGRTTRQPVITMDWTATILAPAPTPPTRSTAKTCCPSSAASARRASAPSSGATSGRPRRARGAGST